MNMIDTIVLTLSNNMYELTHPDKFIPSARWVVLKQSAYGIQSKQNPTKKELVRGIYKPRLTISNRLNALRIYEPMLKIELSLPKLLFGNNFNELQYKDFPLIANKLVAILEDMGVRTSVDLITQAPIAAIHYSKNMPFTDGTIPYHYINKIKEANIQLSLDVNQTDYRNEGHSYKWHCNAYEVVFYDKVKDLEQAKKSSKRSLEHDSALQFNIIELIKKTNKLEILRMEVRLNKRAKIKQLFQKLNIKIDLTFKKLFKPALAKKVLLHYIDELESKRSPILNATFSNDKALLSSLIINNPTMNPKQILQAFGLKKALEAATTRELRTMFSQGTTRSWQRLIRDVNNVKFGNKNSSFAILKEHLVKFKPLKINK